MTFGKHFINAVDDPVTRGLKSLVHQDASLRLIEEEKVIYRKQSQKKVLLLAGGGSGHEPAHAGYIGDGCLDICVAGEIFASPSASQVLAGIKALPSPQGILMIVKNYTGDKLNFGLAAQKAKALGIQTNVVFVGDDVAVEGNDLVGRRGLAGVVFVHKIAGALAKSGATLEEVTTIAQKTADNLITVGVSLDRCSVPSRHSQEHLPSDVLEYGMGIHNEPGVRREAIPTLSVTIANMLKILDPEKRLPAHRKVVLMVNNFGGLSVLELNVIAEEVVKQLGSCNVEIRRTLVGTFVTSLDGPGFSVTIFGLDDGIEELLNEQTTAPAWPNYFQIPRFENGEEDSHKASTNGKLSPCSLGETIQLNSSLVQNILQSIKEFVVRDEPLITKYDTIAGDGDCGETLLRGVNSVYTKLEPSLSKQSLDLAELFQTIATTVERSMGGTSGAIYAIFFSAVSNYLFSVSGKNDVSVSLNALLAAALKSGLTELYKFTTARNGHKTLMDALIPFVETFEATLDFDVAAAEASKGAESTRRLDAVLGRASYVGKEVFEKDGGIPDPGAIGLVSLLSGISAGLRE